MLVHTLEKFIEEATKIHGDLYDYSICEYINTKHRMTIICNTCGCNFRASYISHISDKRGCPSCKNKEQTYNYIKKLKLVHGDKYDYSDLVYTNTVTKVKIYCNYHKEYFYINLNNLLAGSGCTKCARNVPTLEDFVRKSIEIHGDKYSYDYIDTKDVENEKVKIFCNTHKKLFVQKRKDHLIGHGCPYCAKVKKKTTEEFVEESIKVHGDKYDYTNTLYKNIRNKVTIFCKTHLEYFEIKASSFLQGCGCPKCNTNQLLTNEEFIRRAIIKHGDLYDYSKVNIINSYTNVEIYCKRHKGYFKQNPTQHTINSGCPICSKNKRLTTEEFIKRSVDIHGNLYDYSSVEYVNCRTTVKIFCKLHLEYFDQLPPMHLKGCGCQTCSNSKGEVKVKNILDKMNILYKPQYKNVTCVYKKMLRFDFGILDSDENLIGAIEYNGNQHYKPFDFSRNKEQENALKEYKILCLKDNIKKEWCEKNNIPMLILKYDEDDNLENNVVSFLTTLVR